MEFDVTTTKEITEAIAEKAGVTNTTARQLYYAFSAVIEEKLKEGKEVRIPYIGTFHFYKQKTMVSNLTGQTIPPHRKVKFRFRPDLAMYIRKMSREF